MTTEPERVETTTDESAEQQPAHGLVWGIKSSFMDYLGRMPDGRAAIGGGAISVGGNQVFFSLAGPPVTSVERIEWTFRGDVRFTAHGGMLYVRLSDPVLSGSLESAVLTVVESDDGPRIPLVTLRLELDRTVGTTQLWTGGKVELTQDGAGIFNQVYSVGEPFEPIAVQLPGPV